MSTMQIDQLRIILLFSIVVLLLAIILVKIKEINTKPAPYGSRTNPNLFRKKIEDWLKIYLKDTTPIWADNHPTKEKDSVHYTIGRLRICCEKKGRQEYWYLVYNLYDNNDCYSIRTIKYRIGVELLTKVQQFNVLIDNIKEMQRDDYHIIKEN